MRARLRHALWASLLVGGLGAALALTPIGSAIESELGLQWLFNLRGAVTPPGEAVIVSVGARSLARLEQRSGQPALRRCIAGTRQSRLGVWPRCLYARLIERLSEAGARVIVMDVYFTEPGDGAEDAQLAAAMARSGRVLLLQRTSLEYDPSRKIRLQTLTSPLPGFAAAARGVGPFPLPKVPARVDQFWAFKPAFDDAPTLPALALRAYAGKAADAVPQALHGLGLRLPPALLAASAAPPGGAALAEEMQSLRQLVRARPDAGKRAEAVLNGAGDTARDGDRPRLARALLRLYGGGDSRYLNLYGPAGTLHIIPGDEILAADGVPASDRNALRGKAVFIGSAEQEAVEQEDDFHTVFSQADGLYLSGVEIAATAFLNLLHDSSLRSPNNLLVAGLVAAFGAAVTLLVFALPVALGLVVSLALAALFAGGAVRGFAAYGLWLPTVTPLALQLPLGIAAGLFLHYRDERDRRDKAHEAIRQYLPETAAESLIRSGGAVVPTEMVRGICLATDIEQFTALAERTGAKALMPLMNEYLAPINQAVTRHGGDVMEFRGDSVMCVWRDQPAGTEARRYSCLAALEINAAVDRYNRMHQRHRMPTRIGLDVGEVAVGAVGGETRLSFTVVGDAANTASRIENLNKRLGTRVLASAAIVEGLSDIVVRRVGTYLLAGKSNAIGVYELVGAGDDVPAGREALCRSFAPALASFERGAWAEACARLEAHRADYPDDGVARFLLELSREHAAAPPSTAAPWIITMIEK